VLLATASAILILVLIAAAVYCLRSYRPTRVPVVERARVSRDMRARVNTHAMLRLRLHQQRRAGRSRPPTTTPDDAPISGAPVVAPVSAPISAPTKPPASTTPPDTHPLALVQCSLAHNRNGASRPGSYFRIIEAPSQETITSEVRGPWAAKIVTGDGRITLPDSGADVEMAWGGTEQDSTSRR
jgi:hypothetical protein